MNTANITPDFVTMIINIVGIVIILLGFLLGLKRGMFKASYRFIVTLVIIVGCWIAFPAIMRFICSFDLSQFGSFGINGYQITTLNDLFEFITKMALGLIEETESGWTTYTGDVVIAETQMYTLIYGIASMIFKLVFMLIIIILNFTVFRFLFGIVYLIIRPKKKVTNKRGKKVRAKPKGTSRLLGGTIGAVNAIFILFLIFVPLSGFFSIATDFTSIFTTTSENKEEQIPLSLSFGGELLNLSESEEQELIEVMSEWSSVYRDSFVGAMFGIPIGEESIDHQVFDSLFVIKAKDGNSQEVDVKFRKEIGTCAHAVGTLTKNIMEPLQENNYQFTNDMIDKITGEDVRGAFAELSNLDFVKVVAPVGMEFFSNYIDGNEEFKESLPEYVDLNELSSALIEVDMSELMADIGNVVGSLFELAEATGYTPSQILNAEDTFVSDFMGRLISSEGAGEATKNFFNAVAEVEIIDSLNTTFVGLIDTSLQETLETTLLLKPRLTVSEDGYIEINGVKSSILYDDSDLNNAEIVLNEYGAWVINGQSSGIDGTSSQMRIDFSDVSLSNEIKNLGNIFEALNGLGITSVASLQAYINGEETDINWDNFTYDNLTALFDALVGDPEKTENGVGSKLISSNSNNVYVLLNNILPNEVRGSLNQVPISGGDLASLALAAKVLVDSGVIGTLSEGEEIDFEKFVNEHSDKLVEELFKSNMLTANMTPICNSLLTMLTSEKIFVIPEDYDWSESGKEDVKGFLTLGVVMMKYQDKFSDLGSLEQEELDELFDTLSEAMCSELMRKNMNNLINYLSDSGIFGNFKLKPLENDDLWTDEEIKNIMAGIKIFLPLLTNEEGESTDLLAKIFQLEEEDINTLLSSRFLVTNIVENLYDYAGEGGALEGFLALENISKDSQLWYDQIVNGQMVTKGELRKLLVNAFKLFNGVDNFNDFDVLVETLISNVSKLNNNLGGNNDEIGEITNSIVLRDSLIKLIKSLPEKSNGLIVVEDTTERPIQWNDSNRTPGELRNMLAAIGTLLFVEGDPETEEDDRVLYNDLLGNNNSEKIGIFLNVSDENIDVILNSIIIVDTFKGYIIEFSEGEQSFLYLRNPDMSSSEWSVALKDFLKAARILLAEEDPEGNITYNINKLQSSDTTSLVSMLLDLNESEVDTLTNSEVIVDTIANSLIEMTEDNSSVISVPEHLKDAFIRGNQSDLDDWKEEIKNTIHSLDVLLEGDADKFEQLGSSNSDDLINMVTGLASDDVEVDLLDELLYSEIMTETISNQIRKFGDQGILVVNDNIDDWAEEVHAFIHSVKKLLADETGYVTMDTLNESEDVNTLLELIVNLTDDELDHVLESKIIIDTIAKNIKSFGGDGSPLVISDDVDNFDTNEWHDEIRNLIISSKMIIATEENGEYTIDITSISDSEKVDDMFNKLIHFSNNFGKEEDDLGKALASVIICDTIINQLQMQDTEHGGALVVAEDIEWKDEGRTEGELRKLFASIGLLFDEDEDIQLSKLEADKILNHIMDLNNNIGEDDDEVGDLLDSKVLSDTIINNIISIDELVINYDVDDERWHDYHEENELKHGELRDLFAAMKVIYGDDSINMAEFSIDMLTERDSDDLTTIFTSHILLDTFYGKLNEVDIIYMPDEMEKDTEEAVSCIESINILLEDNQQLTDIDFDIDTVLDKSEEEINQLFKSQIIKYTVAKVVTEVLVGDLDDFLELDYDYNNNRIYRDVERYEMVAEDLENLIFTLQDLQDCGIEYDQFSFEAFNDAYNDPVTGGNKVPDALQRSRLIVHSLSKMMNSILSESLDDTTAECINTDITEEEWKTCDIFGNEPFEDDFAEVNVESEGELRKVFAVMGDLSEINDAEEIDIESTSETLHSINRSKVLHGVVPEIIDKSLGTLQGWTYDETVRWKVNSENLSEDIEKWDNEIELFKSILNEGEDIDFEDLDVNDETLNLNTLENILVLMSKSRYLNVEAVGEYIDSAINEVFNSDGVITINVVYKDYLPITETEETYNGKVNTWAIEAVDLMNAVAELRDINSNTIIQLAPNYQPSEREYAAKEIGEFLDKCMKSKMLVEVPKGIMTIINQPLEVFGLEIEYNYEDAKLNDAYHQELLINFVDETDYSV